MGCDMAEKLLRFMQGISKIIGGWAFIGSLLLLTATFVAVIIMCFCRCEFGLKRRAPFLGVVGVILPFTVTLILLGGIDVSFLFVILTLSFLYAFILLLIPTKERVVTEEQKNLIKYLDEKLKERVNEDISTTDEKDNVVRLRAVDSVEIEKDNLPKNNGGGASGACSDINFSHVRNVIARLNYFGLSQSDRRMVQDLESWLLQAERGDKDREVKEKINDGLSNLLKIMSKYGA